MSYEDQLIREMTTDQPYEEQDAESPNESTETGNATRYACGCEYKSRFNHYQNNDCPTCEETSKSGTIHELFKTVRSI